MSKFMNRNIASIIVHIFIYILSPNLLQGTKYVTITISNKCNQYIWPAIHSNSAVSPSLPSTAFFLRPSESRTLYVPLSWSGRIWGRTLCTRVGPTKLSCLSGNCDVSFETSACSVTPPAVTLAEFALNGGANGSSALGAYYVSLLHGFNVPISVGPTGENCTETGCFTDLNKACPNELIFAIGNEVVACRSACEALGEPYCCGSMGGCGKDDNIFSKFFDKSCPMASTTFACASNGYVIAFCPSPSSSSDSSEASNNRINGEDETKINSDSSKSKFSVGLKVVVSFLAIACGIGLLGFAFWCFCGNRESPALLHNFNPQT